MFHRNMFALFLAACVFGCAQQAGFRPEEDALVARKKADQPELFQPEDLAKRDPREGYILEVDPRLVEGFHVLYVNAPVIKGPLERELDDPRRTYNRYILKDLELVGDPPRVKRVVLQCKPGRASCDFKGGAATVKANHRPQVFPVGQYSAEGKLERVRNAAVYWPDTDQFTILVPLGELEEVVGKRFFIWSVYGDFVMPLDGSLIPVEGRRVARLPEEFFAKYQSLVQREALVTIERRDPVGAYLLGVLASRFPLPAPFQKGAASVDLLLGASKLTREDNTADCFVSNDGGQVVLSPFVVKALAETFGSNLWALHEASQPDCGKK